MNNYNIGTLLSIPCDVYDGPMLSEKFISCNINSQPPIMFEAIVSADLTNEQRVIAAVSGITGDSVTLIFNGEMFGAKNPITVPIDWVTQNAQVVSNR